MRLHTFKDGTAVVSGLDTSCIRSDRSGTLTLGTLEIALEKDAYVKLPMIEGNYVSVCFDDEEGKRYGAGNMRTINGRIVADGRYTETELALRHRLDDAEELIEKLEARLIVLEERYSNETLGFLISNPTEV